MNTKRKLNCYMFSNLIISFLVLNLITNRPTTEIVSKTSSVVLNKIYETSVVEVVSVPDTIITTEEVVPVVQINNVEPKKEKKGVQVANTNYVKPSYNSATGNNIVNYARNFLGLRYVSAGNSLVTGTDCSGFTKLIYAEFGISLGRTVSSQIHNGSYVSREDLQPGDLVFYSYGSVASHVAIYMGNGLIIHESTPRDGVKISSVNIMRYITARRVISGNTVSTPPIVNDNNNSSSNSQPSTPQVSQSTTDTSQEHNQLGNSVTNEALVEQPDPVPVPDTVTEVITDTTEPVITEPTEPQGESQEVTIPETPKEENNEEIVDENN